jgi:TPR repeat protein
VTHDLDAGRVARRTRRAPPIVWDGTGATIAKIAVSLLLTAGAASASAQALQRDPAAAADAQCTELLNALNRELAGRRADAFLAAANLYESGQCVGRNETRAVEFLGQAARAGNALAVRRLSRRFALGQGVPQSYANAGAWMAGKGASNEPLQAWDYSIGYAFAVLSEVLATVQYPVSAMKAPVDAAFVLEVNAARGGQVTLKPTAADAASRGELYAALGNVLSARAAEVIKLLPRPDPSLLVNARVAMPMALRLRAEGALDVLEDEPILR